MRAHSARLLADPLAPAPAALAPARPVRPRSGVAVPFWNGVLSAAGAMAFGFAVTIAIAIVVYLVFYLRGVPVPALRPGGVFDGLLMLVFYVSTGAFAWQRLRRLKPLALQPLTRRDLRVVLIGFAVVVGARIATGAVMFATHNAQHVQAGFEHFSVRGGSTLATAAGALITVATIVLIGPFVEEIVFRGLLFGALLRPFGVIAGTLVSATLFAALHADALLFATIAALGIVNALVYLRTRNLTAAFTIHALNNALAAVFLIPATLGAQ